MRHRTHGRNDDIVDGYFKWLCFIVCRDDRSAMKNFSLLLGYLHSREFTYTTIMQDANRCEDGHELRIRFCNERRIHPDLLYLDSYCSVLEMMVALADRMERTILGEDDKGDQTGQWFWQMIFNLGLIDMTDRCIDLVYVGNVIDKLLCREYGRDGYGGLFTVEGTHRDLRKVEIWNQMLMYVDTFYNSTIF